MRLTFPILGVTFLGVIVAGCGKEHGMYEGSQISATIALFAFYAFAFVCLCGSLFKPWGLGPVLAGVFVLVCCAIMLSMTPFTWLGIVLLIAGLALAVLSLRRSQRRQA